MINHYKKLTRLRGKQIRHCDAQKNVYKIYRQCLIQVLSKFYEEYNEIRDELRIKMMSFKEKTRNFEIDVKIITEQMDQIEMSRDKDDETGLSDKLTAECLIEVKNFKQEYSGVDNIYSPIASLFQCKSLKF